MKKCILLVVFTYFELISCAPLSDLDGERTLLDDFKDFEYLLPHENITALYDRYYAENLQFRTIVKHVESEEFLNFLVEVLSSKEMQEVFTYLQNNHLDDRTIFKRSIQVGDDFENDEISTPENTDVVLVNSITSYFDELEALIPVEKARQLFEEKMETSSKFRHFYVVITRQKFKDLMKKVIDVDIVQEKIKEVQDLGVDVKRYLIIDEQKFGFPEYILSTLLTS